MDVPGSTACTAGSPVPVCLVKHILRSRHETINWYQGFIQRERGGGEALGFPSRN